MLSRLEISGVHMELDDALKKYVMRKIGRLDRFISRAANKSVHAAVKLKESKAKNKDERTCEVIFYLPHETITVHEATINIYAAVDIVETKLRIRLKKYKELHESPTLHRRLMARLKRQPAGS